MHNKVPSSLPPFRLPSRRMPGCDFLTLLAVTFLFAVLLVVVGQRNDPLGLRRHLQGYPRYARIIGKERAALLTSPVSTALPENRFPGMDFAPRARDVFSGAEPEIFVSFALSGQILPPAPDVAATPAPVSSEEAMAESSSQGGVALDPVWPPLIARLEKDGFSRKEVEPLFTRLGSSSWSPAFMAAKVTELTGVSGVRVNLGKDVLPDLPEGYVQPVSTITVGEYKAFREKYAEDLRIIKQRYGMPSSVLTAVLLVETGLGRDLGSAPALLALASMASTTTPGMLGAKGNAAQIRRTPTGILNSILRDKSAWAYKELKALIKYGMDSGTDVSKLPGSIYGAVGICQFMPSNIEPYGLDGDGDGVVNLFSVKDAMHSAANYLAEHGWRGARSKDGRFRVLLTYNQDYFYAGYVLGISRQLELAERGKMADGRNPMAGIGQSRGRFFAPSLRGWRRVPPRARISSLGSYQELLP